MSYGLCLRSRTAADSPSFDSFSVPLCFCYRERPDALTRCTTRVLICCALETAALLHYKACAQTRKQKALDIALFIFGLFAMAYTTSNTVRAVWTYCDNVG